MSENYDLTTSSKGLGKLYPILKDKHGNIIDGFHRQNADPAWPTLTDENIETPVQLELARLAVNFCRRTMPATEIEQRVTFLVKSGMKAQEIADMTGISLSTIYKYMPHEAKDQERSEAIKKGIAETRKESPSSDISSKTQDMAIQDASIHKAFDRAEFVECERCHIKTSEPKQWHGHTLCSRCEEKADFNPDAYDGWFRMLERGKAKMTLEPKAAKPSIESWQHRKEVMSQPVAKMDTEMLKLASNSSEIRELGYSIEFQKEYLIMVCRSDLSLVRNGSEVMCFWDGSEVHKNPERDEANRERAKQEQQRHGTPTEILSEPYKAYSDGERDRLFGLLLERLREIEKWGEPKSTVKSEEAI
jgi:DNA-binding CsgD family transcriptional regulator